jgi:hypothetical protein
MLQGLQRTRGWQTLTADVADAPTDQIPRPTLATVAKAGVVAVLVGSVATVVAAVILVPLLGIGPGFILIKPAPVALFTILYGVAAAIVYAVVARRARHPRRLFIRLAVVAFVLLLIPDAMLLINPTGVPFADLTTSAVLGLVILHFIGAPIIVVALLRLAPIPD